MATEISICNMALAKLGQGRITTIETPNSKNAELCQLYYAETRDAVLCEAPWKFATKRYTLTALGDAVEADSWGPNSQFRKPAEVIHVWRCYTDVSMKEPIQDEHWQLEEDIILTPNSDTLYIKGIRRVIETSKFNTLFTNSLVDRLAAEMCIPITQDKKREAMMWNMYFQKVALAKSVETSQGRRERTTSNRLTRVRYL